MMKRFERLDVTKVAADSMRETKQDFIEWQQEQMNTGKKSTGGPIKPFYRPATVRIKKAKGQPYDRVTLKDTGAFQDSFFLVVKPGDGTFKVVFTNIKGPWLVDKYGESIFGLGGVYKVGYVRDLRPVFMRNIKKELKVP